jgi:hypothetical protein
MVAQPVVYDADSNLPPASVPQAEGAPHALQEVYEGVVNKAEKAMRWYESRQRSKRAGARWTRMTAIVMGALATIIPSIIAFIPEKSYPDFQLTRLNPIATVLGVAAATMILLDKFYGFSTSWMRFVNTYQDIQSKLDAFRINWQKQVLLLNANDPPTDQQVAAMYDMLAAFSLTIDDAVRAETQAWASEFKQALADVDRTVEAQRAAAASLAAPGHRGGINVSVADYETLDDKAWSVQLDNRQAERKVGQASAALPMLEPGHYRVRIEGARQHKPVAAEQVVAVKVGEIAEVRFAKLG